VRGERWQGRHADARQRDEQAGETEMEKVKEEKRRGGNLPLLFKTSCHSIGSITKNVYISIRGKTKKAIARILKVGRFEF
jgi:hypothetical protein